MAGPPVESLIEVEERPLDRLSGVLVAALIVVVLPTVSVASTEVGNDQLWMVAIVVGALLVPTSAPATAASLMRRPLRWGVWAACVLAVAMLVGLVVNQPVTQNGAFWTAAAAVGAATAGAISEMDRTRLRLLVVLPLAFVSAVQGALMAVQIASGEPFALSLIQSGAELRVIDGILRGQGTFVHVFEPALLATIALGAVALLARDVGHRRSWRLLAAAATVPVALSYSRSAAMSAAAVIVALVVAHRKDIAGALPLAISMAVGLVLAAALVAPGWLDRVEHSATSDVDDLTLGRITLARQALTMIADHPITGVGTAKYIPTLETEYEPDPDHPFAVHNFALRVTAELGIPLGLVVVALTVVAGIASFRAGPLEAAAYVTMVPWLVFDILYYDRVFGLLAFGVWWGLTAARPYGQTSLATRSS